MSEKQIRLIFYINSKLIPFVLEYYKELIKQLRMKHTEMKDEYLILFEKIPTFKYDGRVVRMFAFDVIADECKREKYLINVLQNFLMDVKNCKIQEKLIKDIEKVDYKLIELSILEIKLNRQQILRQDLSYDKIIVETKNNKGAVDKTQCELAEAITLFNCDLLEWTGSKPKLQYFSKLLQRYSIILDLRGVDSECETFMSIFKNSKGKPFGNKNPKPIQLSEGIKIADLAYIITKLKLDELISNSNSKVKTNKLFLNEHGKEIKYKSFRTSDKSDRKPRHKFEIDEIFSLLRKFGE